MKKYHFFAISIVLLFASFSQAQLADHAAPKTAKAGLSILKLPVKAAHFLATHSLTSIKDSAGAAVFAFEDGVIDPLHLGFAAADAAVEVNDGKVFGATRYVFHIPNLALAKADSYTEQAELFLFGKSN